MLQGTTAFARVGAINHVRSPDLFSFIFYEEACSFLHYRVAKKMPHLLAAISSSLLVPSVPDGLAAQAKVLVRFSKR
jgi:hypothetical protein